MIDKSGENMPVVGVMTIYKGYLLSNYGSFFQHYALRRVLRDLGYSPFRLKRMGEQSGGYWHWLIRSSVTLFRCLLCFFVPTDSNVRLRRILQQAIYAGWVFRRSYNRLIGKVDEDQYPGESILGIVGSDQVWTDLRQDVWLQDRLYKKKVAYAASADWEQCHSNKRWALFASKALQGFSNVSIREKVGVKTCRAIAPRCHFEIFHAIDPVMLLPQRAYTKIISSKEYFDHAVLVCYLVNIRSKQDLKIAVLERVARNLRCELRIVGIQGTASVTPSCYLLNAGPCDFLRIIRDARCIITNSFHGLVFSIIFGKQFMFWAQRNLPGMDQNARQRELLAWLSLQDRECSLENADIVTQVIQRVVDWETVNGRISARRDKSLAWLKKSLD